jgi:FkbM family methyltransferase
MKRCDIRPAINRRLHRIGWDTSRWPSADDPGLRRQGFFAANHIDFVIDVGANAGVYGNEIRAHGYAGLITSFEPTAVAFAELEAIADQDGDWSVQRTAVGASTGELTMHIGEHSVSSSALPMLDRLDNMAYRYVGDETVPLDRLDNLVANRIGQHRAPFLKIDTAGVWG